MPGQQRWRPTSEPRRSSTSPFLPRIIGVASDYLVPLVKPHIEPADPALLIDLLVRLTSDVRAVASFLLAGPDVVTASARLLFFGGAMFLLDWQLAVVSLVVAPVLWWAGSRFALRLRRASRQTRRRSGSLSAMAEESLSTLALATTNQSLLSRFRARNSRQPKPRPKPPNRTARPTASTWPAPVARLIRLGAPGPAVGRPAPWPWLEDFAHGLDVARRLRRVAIVALPEADVAPRTHLVAKVLQRPGQLVAQRLM